MILNGTSPTWQSHVDLNIHPLRGVILTGHISLLRIVTELSNVEVLAERQPIVVLANIPSLVTPKARTVCSPIRQTCSYIMRGSKR